ncbi:MAG: substrate-binding domain-containing protein [Proteobacteria bacterium]|nr:substrate-binding domain-containing protein [Pseudomonadota bacterium]
MSLSAIARSLGLSVTTVSRALGGFPDVAAATRARVEAEAARIGYRPNLTARRLKSGRSETVGVVLPAGPGQFDDPFFLRLLAAVGPPLQTAGLDLMVATARPGTDELRAYRRMVEDRRVDGIILGRTRRRDDRIAYLIDSGMPFVTHGRTEETRPYAHLDIDGRAAFLDATARLIGFGHRRIGLINAAETYMFAHHRQDGWRAALDDAGLEPGPLAHAEPTEENGFRAMEAMLRAPAPPTAVLCGTDRLAVGALHAAAAAGLRAGRDISVIGYDDLPVAAYTDPPLTTLEQPIDRMGARLAAILLALLGGADAAGFSEIWQARLIARASDGPAPSDAAGNTYNAGAAAPANNKSSKGANDETRNLPRR